MATKKQQSDIYMYDDERIRVENDNTKDTSLTNFSHSIVFDSDLIINNAIHIYGKTDDDIFIPFRVYYTYDSYNNIPEDVQYEESNLMTMVTSSSSWCYAYLDKDNRVLRISITNKPLIKRESEVILSIIDFPETYVRLSIINERKIIA